MKHDETLADMELTRFCTIGLVLPTCPAELVALTGLHFTLHRSPNGDTWFIGREPTNGHAFIIHQPNAPSGGRFSHIEFLRDAKGPEQQALLRLIGTLVEVPPFRLIPAPDAG